MMTPRSQKLALLAHITFSVGWFGAVVPYLVLAIAALTSRDEQKVRAACLSMELIGWFVIVPFSLAALASGLVQSVGTRWGLFRHWWIVAKLVLTVIAIAILFQHMHDVSRVSATARHAVLSSAELRPELIHSAGGLLALFVIMTISVFKPWGLTPYGRRRVSQAESVSRTEPRFADGGAGPQGHRISWGRIVGYHAIAIAIVLVVVLHLTGGSFHPH